MVVADNVAVLVDQVYAAPGVIPVGDRARLAVFAYSVQILCDFSGYTDMAVGLGRILGIELPPNFNLPYTSQSITEFWQRWHISLSTWLRDYLYIPLGGNRRGPTRTHVNLMLTMLLGGLWHERAGTSSCGWIARDPTSRSNGYYAVRGRPRLRGGRVSGRG